MVCRLGTRLVNNQAYCGVQLFAQLMKSFEKVDERLLDYTLGLAFCTEQVREHVTTGTTCT